MLKTGHWREMKEKGVGAIVVLKGKTFAEFL